MRPHLHGTESVCHRGCAVRAFAAGAWSGSHGDGVKAPDRSRGDQNPYSLAVKEAKEVVMLNVKLLLLILALLCFIIAAFNVPVTNRLNIMALGLAFWVLSIIVV